MRSLFQYDGIISRMTEEWNPAITVQVKYILILLFKFQFKSRNFELL